MPTYRYRGGRCGEELEVWQSITDSALTEHEVCGGELQKVLSAAGIVLKGSGFYKTDNRSGNGSRRKSGDSGDSSSEKKDSGSSSSSSSEKKDSGSSGTSDSGSSTSSSSSSSSKSS
jgi:putative FmdB family regulatory protein